MTADITEVRCKVAELVGAHLPSDPNHDDLAALTARIVEWSETASRPRERAWKRLLAECGYTDRPSFAFASAYFLFCDGPLPDDPRGERHFSWATNTTLEEWAFARPILKKLRRDVPQRPPRETDEETLKLLEGGTRAPASEQLPDTVALRVMWEREDEARRAWTDAMETIRRTCTASISNALETEKLDRIVVVELRELRARLSQHFTILEELEFATPRKPTDVLAFESHAIDALLARCKLARVDAPPLSSECTLDVRKHHKIKAPKRSRCGFTFGDDPKRVIVDEHTARVLMADDGLEVDMYNAALDPTVLWAHIDELRAQLDALTEPQPKPTQPKRRGKEDPNPNLGGTQ